MRESPKKKGIKTENITLLSAHQICNLGLDLALGLLDSFLLAYDGNKLLVRILGGGEDDTRACLLPNFTNVGATASNEELMVLGLGT